MIILIAVLVLLFLLCIMPVKVNISYLLYKGENRFRVTAGPVVPFICVTDTAKKKKVKEKKAEKEGNQAKKVEINFEFIKNVLTEAGTLFEYFRKKLEIEKFKLHFHIGADEAALTGIATGAAYGALYNIAAIFDNRFNLKEKDIHISPDFESAVFETDINVKMSVKFLSLVIFGGKTYKSIKKLKLI